MPGFQSVHIQRFKNIDSASFNLRDINVIVGGNNSGKSSVLQALHFTVGIIQSLSLEGRLSGRSPLTATVNPAKLIYIPSDDVHALGAGGILHEPLTSAIKIDLTLQTGEAFSVSIRKGRARNILVSISDIPSAMNLASLERPFTIFTPGLAGIAKTEQYVSDGVLLRTIARGDANLVLRNTLLRLWKLQSSNSGWRDFLGSLGEVFPRLVISISFQDGTDEFIKVTVNNGNGNIPLELSGTGILQAMQIFSYIYAFSPCVIVLDEPDSHLHPNNQRLLCSLLRRIAKTKDVQVILGTHSRHVIDALQGTANFLWAQNGTVDCTVNGSELAILLDLGALDIKEKIGAGVRLCVVLTEDEDFSTLNSVLESSGFDINQTQVLSYYGCTQPHNLRPLIEMIRAANQRTTIIVHKDRDYHSDNEIQVWATRIRTMGAEPFVTKGVDIESHILNSEYLAVVNPQLTSIVAQELIDRAMHDTRDISIKKYVNGRCDIAKKNATYGQLNIGQLAIQAPQDYDANPQKYCHGKTVIAKVRDLFRNDYDVNLRSSIQNDYISDPTLSAIAQRIFPNLTP